MQRSVDYIIVGFGLAGAILAFKCWKKNKSFVIYDSPHTSSASSVSSGLINPITGRRFVKSWQYDQLLKTLIETYSQIELEFDIDLLAEINIQRSLFTIKDENLWTTISQNEPQYCLFNNDDSPWDAIVKHSHRKGILKGFKLNPQLLLQTLTTHFQDRIIYEAFDHESLAINTKGVGYKEVAANKIVFCEGWHARSNPFFSSIVFEPAKGEVLIVRIPNFTTTRILKDKVFLIHIKEDIYWVGSTYEWTDLNDKPTKEKREQIETILHELLNIPFEVIDHLAGVRPSIKERRPVAMVHPEHSALFFFNGLGTKGASLAPFFADKIIELIS